MKAKDKAWQLYSNYFDIVEAGDQHGDLALMHMRAINAALYCVDEALTNALCKTSMAPVNSIQSKHTTTM
jgi:hypothetical protein